ncbi:hypothetical protein QLQ12_12595 [Actinoplanes sp. NEAU-A12]|uniref:DUF5667 domain-containing protein n=1 Tax=Actinoplanes sandaracinus TaxID=3045177 RepID=A0ABT6WI84_9ACTN|nr:hypothetical protein [Actinoplanes sandaracinus]MDI6099433.1 hypothetical protein [Actinoplanes sandaracinus]
MSPAKDVDRQVARLARVTDDELTGHDRSGPARDLMAAIVDGRFTPAEEERSSRSPVGRRIRRFAVAAAMTFAVVVGPSLLPDGAGTATSYANAAIEIEKEGGEFVARIKDPLADSALYEQGFQAVGRDVEIVLVPVPPSMVGMLLEAGGDGGMRVTSRLVCAGDPEPCSLEIRVSADGDGTVRQTIGRAAQPGEDYRVPGSADPQQSVPGSTGGGSGD